MHEFGLSKNENLRLNKSFEFRDVNKMKSPLIQTRFDYRRFQGKRTIKSDSYTFY